MRTTIRLPDDLLREAKQRAAETGRTLTSLIEDALRAALRRQPTNGAPVEPVRLTTYGRGGTLSGVDLDDSAALLDRMESADRTP
jgi:hypothetical protein